MNQSVYAFLFSLIILIGILLVTAIKVKIIPARYSYHGFFFVFLLGLVLTGISHPTMQDLGILLPSIDSIGVYTIMTLLSCVIIWFLAKTNPSRNFVRSVKLDKILFYSLLSTPAQEFQFRSFVYYSLGKIDMLSFPFFMLISSVLFGFAHWGYDDKKFMKGAFIMGIMWSTLYYFYPNIFLVTLSHAIVGICAYKWRVIDKKIFQSN